jgi:hypothetical protein
LLFSFNRVLSSRAVLALYGIHMLRGIKLGLIDPDQKARIFGKNPVIPDTPAKYFTEGSEEQWLEGRYVNFGFRHVLGNLSAANIQRH